MDTVLPRSDLMSTEQNRNISRAVETVGQKLMGFIRARVSSQADAEDVLQDVWQQLATTLQAGPIEQVGAWLFTVARRRIIDRARKPKMASLDALVGGAEEDTAFDFAEFFLRDDNTPQTEHLRRLFWDQLYTALAELPEAQRQVFVWHELEAMSFQDIADLTGENLNTLLSRKRYAVLHLRQRLESVRQEFLLPRP